EFMASKIFMGSMPELMENILNNLENEYNTLYSCTLVSRHWCKISIPILWQDPFSFDRIPYKPAFVSNYFSFLNEDEKFILGEYGINPEFSKTLFNYARFLK
ncbi:1362_t:CDS:1, partial [Cetraspora pellucida]